MKDKDQVELTSKVFEYLGIISFIAFTLASLFDDMVFELFFTGDYVKGVDVFPFLFLSPLILMLFQIAGNQLLIVKKSYFSTLCLLLGLIANLLLNYFLIPFFGIKGAALATLLGYSFSTISMLALTQMMKLISLKFRFLLMTFITIIFTSTIFYFNLCFIIKYSYALCFLCLFVYFYKEDIFIIIRSRKS